MASQGLGHILVLIFTCTLFLFGLAVIAKHIKTAVALFSIAVIWFVSIFFFKSSLVIDGEKARTGLFMLDPKQSRYDSIDLSTYSNTELHIKPGNTFEIGGKFPLLKKTKGKWQYIDDGDISYTEYQFDGEAHSTQMQVSGINSWVFNSNFINNSAGNRLVFVRNNK